MIGLGTYRINDEEAKSVVYNALKVGYKSIDTAYVYRNENGVGMAVRKFMSDHQADRSSISVTTKLSPRSQGYAKAPVELEKSFANLNLAYIDCYLIHWPGASGKKVDDLINKKLRRESWEVLEGYQKSGKIKALGISNYTISHIRELLEHCSIKPRLLQTEFHPLLHDSELLQYCTDNGIRVQAYSSFGEGSLIDGSIKLPQLDVISAKHSKSKAQVLLRWALQHDVAVIPKSSKVERMKENLNVFDFELDSVDMEALDSLDFVKRFCWDPTVVV